MDAALQIVSILWTDPVRWRLLGIVKALGLPDCWIGTGFIRNAVWDHLHGRMPSGPAGDVDVIWYGPCCRDPSEDRKYEATLRTLEPAIAWSVKSQARMHERNGDDPYVSATEAMRFWPETATAIAVRRVDHDAYEVAAPFGLDDLMGLLLKPTPHFASKKRGAYQERVRSKGWMNFWLLLTEIAD